jgi:hypothetical protein
MSTEQDQPTPDLHPQQQQPNAETDAPADETGAADAEAAPALYDADAAQIVPVVFEDDGEDYEALLRSAPLSDELIRTYARERDKGNDNDEEEPSGGLLAKVKAAEKMFPQFITGPADEQGEGAEEWREVFGAQDKLGIITTLLLCERVPSTLSRPKQLKDWRTAKTSRVRLRCYFNGKSVETSHVLKKSGAALYADYARGSLAEFDEMAQLDQFADIYEKLHVGHEGYKGRVPIHHKASAVRAHLERIARVTRKN